MADLLENLNERQREAVLETEGYVRVIAGAGSGKTKLLVSRYAYLVQDYGIDSSNILCVTFTNKAAGEMKKRIRALIGDTHDTSLICTYHGFCNRLLRENPEKLFLDKQFQIIDDRQQKAILGEIYQKFELKLDYASFESILHKIGFAKKDMSYVAKLCDPKPCQILNEIKNQDDEIIEEFLQRQKATYSLDFHDLISFAIYLLEKDADVREKWQNRLNYIMVDEFQDSSAIEMRLVELLSGMFRNLMIVGDPDQNIYEWRGSDVKLLVDFDKGHEPTKTIILNQNYRSTPQILNCANHLIEKNELRLKKDLFTKNAAGAPVVHYHSRDEFEEMDRVIENIRRLHEREGLKYSDIAVIYRSSSLSRVAEKKLVEKNIPYEIFGGVRFYQRMEILDILAYLKLIAYDDDVSFRRIVNKPRRRFGRAKMNLLEKLQKEDFNMDGGDFGASAVNHSEKDGAEVFLQSEISFRGTNKTLSKSLFETLVAHLDEKDFAGSDAAAFIRFVEEMREESRRKRISELVNNVTKNSGYESYIRELGDEERLNNLAEFKRLANEFEREFGENLTLHQFLQQVALQSDEDANEEKDTVKLMTIHASKGLEFPAVFILGFTEGIFPSAKTIGDRKKLGLEEERRLCYVAITRAEKYLFLMDSEGLSQNGIKKLVSRFLEEIGEQNYVRVGRISEELKKESCGYTAKLNSEIGVEEGEGKKAGDVVEHHIFGKGTVESVDEKRGSYLIRFERLGQARNISKNYFEKKHEDAREKKYGKQVDAGREMKYEKQVEMVQETKEVEEAERGSVRTEPVENAQRVGKAEEKPGQEIRELEEHKVEPSREIGKLERSEAEPNRGIRKPKGIEVELSRGIGKPKGIEMKPGQGIGTSGESEAEPSQGIEKSGENEVELNREIRESGKMEVKPREEIKKQERTKAKPDWSIGKLQEISEIKELKKILGRKEVAEPEKTYTIPENEIETQIRMELEKAAREAETREKESASAQSARLKELKENSPNLWKRDDVPHTGWNCAGVEDLGAPVGICEMCGYQIIRYAHHMEHPQYHSLSVGCVCAGRMEGDVAGAKQREAEFKNKQTRRVNFFKRRWKQSKKGNEYLKIDGHVVVIYHNVKAGNLWKYAIDNEFCQNTYATRERAMAGAFDALEILKGK